ncbi:hypothetical protein CCR75_001899 [Bremia lactucae]|uniref:Tyrosine-protein kinase ephrin type A/B receptor-like domain-containing protein n=1 Tax=Bremia lactucae TaxID=4779 RepID=A0A976FIE4_BRELC|nr:hypothetical protein CCR75_001899 [Bremia lactucae]
MWTALGLCAGGFLASRAYATEPQLRYGFGDCVDEKRTLYYYIKGDGTCSANSTGQVLAKPPVHGLRCDVHCARGFYLGANFSGPTPVSSCERCPQGKYSLGGGKLFSQRTNAWTSPLPVELETDCMTQDMFTGEWKHNCNPWSASKDGSLISSGENSGVLENFGGTKLYSTLRIGATFVRDGYVTFKYRVDAELPYDGLVFQVDDTAGAESVSQSDGWKEKVVPVTMGAHVLAWHYRKDYTGDVGEDKAFLKVIEVVGTAYSDLHCHTCGGDMTNSGGSLCAFCDVDEYAAAKSNSELEFTCYTCPDNTHAPKGSIGISSCVEQRPCSLDDVNATYTPCTNGLRNVTYSWRQPQTCELQQTSSIQLPKAEQGVECASCARGYQLGQGDECEPCGTNQVRSVTGQCTICRAGTVVVKTLEFGVGTPDGWEEWPSIVDATAATKAGWKLTKSGVLLAQHTSPDDESGRWKRPSRTVLLFHVLFEHSGSLTITYNLSGVPTFEDIGSRAWVELEIRDVGANSIKIKREMNITGSSYDVASSSSTSDVTDEFTATHLLHGSENGEYNQVIPINVTTAVMKEIALVVRATSAEAKRAMEVRVMFLGLVGTRDGAGVTCDNCPMGYAPFESEGTGCHVCPAGTFADTEDPSGIVACVKCPLNTYSKEGASTCTPCGANTYSEVGAITCAAPQALTVKASPAASSSSSLEVVSSALGGLQVTYNLSLLEALVWGNASLFLDDTVYGNATSLLSTTRVHASIPFEADGQSFWFSGLFRPLGTGWKEKVPGQIVDEQVDTNKDVAHVVIASITNPREAGHFFQQNSGLYGNVLCSAPPQWKVVNGGRHMEILPLDYGAGVKVSFTDGSGCVKGKTMTTTFHFECDLGSGTTSKPATVSVNDDDKCDWNIVWKTAYACPICDDDYFNELRSTCNGGEQLVSYARKLACYGGAETASTNTISTCSESAVVLNTKDLYSVYAVIVVIGFIVLLLLMGILIIHRKYRNVYNDYLYLKGKLPTDEKEQGDGTNETTFEFTPTSNALHSSPMGLASSPASSGQVDVDLNDDGVELQKIRSV